MAYYYPAWVYAFSAVVTGGTFWLFGNAGIILLLVLVLLDQFAYRVRYGHWQPADPAKRERPAE